MGIEPEGRPRSGSCCTRRTANEDDVVFEIQLTQSRDDLVITSSPENLN